MPARVLIIDDDRIVQDLLRALLEEAGYRVLAADATLDPVDVSQLRPDLILLDLWFGGAAWGLDWLRGLRVTPGARRIPVIVCTADASLAKREAEQLQALAIDVILKPFDLDDVVTRVAAGLSSRAARDLVPPAAPIAPQLGAD
jgi:two-component system chemotaxis response regulator CheY